MKIIYKGFKIKGFKTFLEMGMKYDLSEQALYRLRVIDFYYNKSGKSIKKTSNHFLIHRNTIGNWLKHFEPRNLRSLEPKKRIPIIKHRKTKLNEYMKEKILEIRGNYPYYGKEKIKKILERDYEIQLSSSTIGRYLKKKNLVYEWRRQESSCKFKKLLKRRKTNKKT